jgi:hypothetical protein
VAQAQPTPEPERSEEKEGEHAEQEPEQWLRPPSPPLLPLMRKEKEGRAREGGKWKNKIDGFYKFHLILIIILI